MSSPLQDSVDASEGLQIVNVAEVTAERVKLVRSASTGSDFSECLKLLPNGRDSKSYGYTFNRFIKVLAKEGKLPPENGCQNYGSIR